MNEISSWIWPLILSMAINGVLWLQLTILKINFKESTNENIRLFELIHSNNLTIVKLRGLLREKGDAAIHGKRVSEN